MGCSPIIFGLPHLRLGQNTGQKSKQFVDTNCPQLFILPRTLLVKPKEILPLYPLHAEMVLSRRAAFVCHPYPRALTVGGNDTTRPLSFKIFSNCNRRFD